MFIPRTLAELDGIPAKGALGRAVIVIGLVTAPLVSIASIGTQITEAFAGLDRIREVLDMPTELDEDAARHGMDALEGDVRFDRVWFEYVPGQPVLRGVSFHAPPGTTTARSPPRRAQRPPWPGPSACPE